MGVKTKVTGARSPRWAFMNKMVIQKTEGDQYLTRRRIIQTPAFGVYLHHIHREDYEYDLHDHPWNFFSIILRGGYVEEYCTMPNAKVELRHERLRKRGSIKKMPMGWAHRIAAVLPNTITLVLVGRRHGTWGFYTPTGWVDWRDYDAIHG